MSTNRDLQRIFDQLASGLEIADGSSFKVTSHRRVARLLRDMTKDVRALVDQDPATAARRLTELPGIGKGAARRILEYLDRGEVEEHQKLLERVPAGLFDLLEIPGIGPKAAQLLWRELGVESVDDLRRELDSGGVEKLPGMGKKTVDNLRKAIVFETKTRDRIPLGAARPLAESLVARLAGIPGVGEIAYCGSLRRGRETIGDIDLLAWCVDEAPLRQAFQELSEVTQVLASGDTKSSVRLEADSLALQTDLRIVPKKVWGAALLYFTGSKEHNVRLREIAIRQRKHLNEYGLFAGTEERPQDEGQEPLAARTEREIYSELGLDYVPPELREDRGELTGFPDRLIELGHIRSELHAHTTASDGKLELDELAALAATRGFHTLAITDHSKSSVLTNGLTPDRLLRHIEAIREADQRHPEIRLLAGAEVDILPDGSLDYDDELLAQLDLVVASPHATLTQDPETATRRLVRALGNPFVDILGHPTGRILGKRQGLEPDLDQVCKAAAANDTALEINANPRRLDLRDTHVRTALEHGCKLAINTDVHWPRNFDHLIYGVLTARRGFAPRSACINSWTARQLARWLAKRRRLPR